VEFRILGPVEVWSNGAEVPLDGAKQRTTLAALLLDRERVLSDSELSALLWGDHPPTTLNAQIYTYISRLRKRLGGSVEIIRRASGYMLSIKAGEFDYEQFESWAKLGRTALEAHQYAEASASLHAALACWRGPVLGNVTDFLTYAHGFRLEETRLSTLDARIEADLQLGRHDALVPELTGLVAAYPLREGFRAQLMIALYRTNRRSDALATFHEARRVLAEQTGCDPGTHLAKVYAEVLSDSPALAWRPHHGDAGQVVVTRRRPSMLPAAAPVLLGRAAELGRIRSLLTDDSGSQHGPGRFPVLTGMAGIGKTALAVHAARELAQDYPDGQLYADLGAESTSADPAVALHGFLRALGVAETAIPDSLHERSQRYWSELAGRRLLVVLDNVADEEQVYPLLPRGSDCRAIVTSRTRMAGLAGGTLVEVGLLTEAQCLETLAALVGADRVAEEPEAARQIVWLCGRHPLAVSIAGMRLAQRTYWRLDQMAARLADRHRLDELRIGSMDVRASILGSYARLDVRDQLAFRRLSLLNVPDFPVWTVAAVLDVSYQAGEAIVERLLDKRLIEVSITSSRSQPARFRLHKLVKLAGQGLASEVDTAEERQAAFHRVVNMWMSLADEAARRPAAFGQGLRMVVDMPNCEVPANPSTWFKSEHGTLRALASQAATLGLGTVAGRLLRMISDLERALTLDIRTPAPARSRPG
jgi:DNA-binding SARP family transcriptional activator